MWIFARGEKTTTIGEGSNDQRKQIDRGENTEKVRITREDNGIWRRPYEEERQKVWKEDFDMHKLNSKKVLTCSSY